MALVNTVLALFASTSGRSCFAKSAGSTHGSCSEVGAMEFTFFVITHSSPPE